MVRFEILLPGGGPAVPLGETPIRVGRGPVNDVVLPDDSVSWHHAQLWTEGGTAWVRDLGSRNGTFVNGERAPASVRLGNGDAVRFGAQAVVELRGLGETTAPWRSRYIEDLGAGVRVLVRSDRFHLGSAPGCDLRVDGWPDRAATILLHANGEVWVGTEDREWQVEVGERFEVLGRPLRVVEDVVGTHAPTVDVGAHPYPYLVQATGNAPGGPQVVLSDPARQRELLLTGNRGVLLFVLARQLARDRESGLGEAEQGWCATDDVLVAVWGRGHKDANHLNVLVHRVRGQLGDEGFDPWFVEKRRGWIRMRVKQVVVQ